MGALARVVRWLARDSKPGVLAEIIILSSSTRVLISKPSSQVKNIVLLYQIVLGNKNTIIFSIVIKVVCCTIIQL